MLVMGGIIGSGIFLNPAEVARQVDTPFLIVGVWLIGGMIAIAGAYGGAVRALPPATSLGTLGTIGAALTPVMFAYGGWQTASFVAAEMRDPRRDLARGLLLGVIGVILLYTGVAFACVYALGPDGLAETRTPATAVMRLALGDTGANLIALGIAISALGFLSQGMLTAPRVYFAMAEDRLFFSSVAAVNARTHVPAIAIALQGMAAILIALSGSYGQILSYVVSVDFIFFGLTGAALFVFRRQDSARASFQVPGHPWTTLLFVAACALIVVATLYNNPVNSLIGFAILAAGIPACLYWQFKARA
jgi:APA family basic amino acid/polyamine antiporter